MVSAAGSVFRIILSLAFMALLTIEMLGREGGCQEAGQSGFKYFGTSHDAAGTDAKMSAGDPKSDGRVTNMFYDTPLREALADVAAQTGRIIITDNSVQGLVTCDLRGVKVEKALEILLAAGNFRYRNMGDYYLVGSGEPGSPNFLRLSQTKSIKFDFIEPSEAIKLLPDYLTKFTTANNAARTISITAPPPVVSRIMTHFKDIDSPPKQIILDARIVVMEYDYLRNLGIEWDFPTIQAGVSANDLTIPNWGLEIGYTPDQEFTNSLLLTLNLLQLNEEATVVANPKLTAQHGKPAEIKVAREEYFEILTQGIYTDSELEKIEVGTTLKITPYICADGQITLEISAEVSDVVARGENDLPVVTRRQAKNTVRVPEGGTAVVGGLIQESTTRINTSVPGAKDIPLLGGLFENGEEEGTRRQVAVFVTPRVVSETRQAIVGYANKPLPHPLVGEEFDIELKRALNESYVVF